MLNKPQFFEIILCFFWLECSVSTNVWESEKKTYFTQNLNEQIASSIPSINNTAASVLNTVVVFSVQCIVGACFDF